MPKIEIPQTDFEIVVANYTENRTYLYSSGYVPTLERAVELAKIYVLEYPKGQIGIFKRELVGHFEYPEPVWVSVLDQK